MTLLLVKFDTNHCGITKYLNKFNAVRFFGVFANIVRTFNNIGNKINQMVSTGMMVGNMGDQAFGLVDVAARQRLSCDVIECFYILPNREKFVRG